MIAPLEPSSSNVQANQRAGLVAGETAACGVESGGRPRGTLADVQRRLGKLTARNPVVAVATAAVIGLALGWMTKRRTP